jgi:Zn-dependent protease with chaperone function
MSSHPDTSLDTGLIALKQGDYQTAIAILEVVASTSVSQSSQVQATIGLVVAYARTGNLPKAIALCELLCNSDNPQVQEWAKTTLKQLTIHKPNSIDTNTNATGFVPFDNYEDLPKQVPQVSRTPISDIKLAGSTVATSQKSPKINWRQAPRAKVWQPLQKSKLNLLPLRLLLLSTFTSLFWVIREMVDVVRNLINDILVKLPFLEPIQLLYRDFTSFLLVVLLILVALAPWLLDRLLMEAYGQRWIERDSLNMHSHEAVRVLHRYSQQRGWRFPKLGIIPLTAPIALTYGNLPRNARIIVSQGLLDQLADDEIAAIYAGQLGHIRHWDFAILSLLLLITIPIYQLHQYIAKLAGKIQQRFFQSLVGIFSSFVYLVWCLITGTNLWLSQLRLYYSDRFACDLTGNPNGLVRALLKIAIGIASDIEKQEQTPWQLESLNLVAPVGYQQSLSLGSMTPNISFESFLMWDYLNPYRLWFTLNNSHPLIGDRIQRLSKIARNWHLDPELYIESQEPLRVKPQSFYLQIAPFLGIPLGVGFAILIWLIWQTAFALKILNLKWIYEDWSFIVGCLFVGFSIGILIRINSFFPEIKLTNLQTDERLPNLLANPSALPIDSIGVRIVGKLLGRRGVSNWLGQDLILHSRTGSVKLHHISWLGQAINPQDLIGRQIVVTGWFRRGATCWIDIQSLQTQNGKAINSPHPVWSTVLAVAAEAWGAFILLRG